MQSVLTFPLCHAHKKQVRHKYLLLLIGGLFLSLSMTTAQVADKALFKMNRELVARDSGEFTIYSIPGDASVRLMIAKDLAAVRAGLPTTTAPAGPVATAEANAVPSCTTPVYPIDGENYLCPRFVLQWAAVPGATGYKVYLSGNPNQNPLPLWGSTTNTSFGPFGTSFGVNGRWRIVPFNDAGDAVGCPIWSYTTGDNIAPSITCPANTEIVAGLDCSGSFGAYSPVSLSDNCLINTELYPVTQTPAGGTLTGIGSSQTITLTARDVAGNSAGCTFKVTLVDQTQPTATTKNYTAILNNSGTALVQPSDVFGQGSDNCGTVTPLSVSPAVFTCADIGPNTVTLKVGDGNGNSAEFPATVTVVASALPAVSISSSAPNDAICAGTSVTFRATPVNGGTAPKYKWTINGIGQSETGPTLKRSNLADGDAVQVTLIASDPCLAASTAVSGVISMTVNSPSVEAGDCQSVYLGYGSNCTTLTASGSGLSYSWSPGGMTGATIEVCPSKTTTYSVITTDQFGCTATDNVVVQVIDVRCGNNNEKVVVCHKGKEICVDVDDVADHLAHGDQLGSCGTTFCSGGSSLTKRSGDQLNLEPVTASFPGTEIALFPNPAGETVTLRMNAAAAVTAQFEIVDLAGKILKAEKRELSEGFNEINLDIHSLPKGLHFIRYTDTNNKVSIIKMSKL